MSENPDNVAREFVRLRGATLIQYQARIRDGPAADLADTGNFNSPSNALLVEDCCSCAILAVLCS
jgi:hypothetical protein